MPRTTYEERRRLETLEAAALERLQLQRLNALLDGILPDNHFYAEKLAEVPRPLRSLEELAALPYTYKVELLGSRPHGETAANLTWPRER